MNNAMARSVDPTMKSRLSDVCLVLAIYSIFLLLPWYYNYSGQVQPVDIALIIAGLLLVLSKKMFSLRLFTNSIYYTLMVILIAYTCARYSYNYILESSHLYEIFSNLYYIVLLTLFTSILFYLFNSRTYQEFYQIILNCLLISTLLPLCTWIFLGSDYGLAALQAVEPTVVRPILTFNNPNQMGFFAFINLSLFFYVTLFSQDKNVKIKKVLSLLIININVAFLFLSVSRAASSAIILYFFSYFLIFQFPIMKKYPRAFWLFISALVALSMVLIYLYHHYLLVQTGITSAIKISFMDDLFIRAINGASYNFGNLYFFIFGNGSYSNPLRGSLEFHNNFISMFNQVGILGLLLYSYLIYKIFFDLLRRGWLYVIPFICYLGYSEMHYAFRTRMNWLFFAMLIFLFINWRISQSSRVAKE